MIGQAMHGGVRIPRRRGKIPGGGDIPNGGRRNGGGGGN